nr:cupredoxin family copper-binding protein [Nocardia sp.]
MVPGGGGSAMPSMPGMTAMSSTSAPATAPANAPAGPNAVTITNFAFTPATLTVPVGTTVTWTNRDEEPHNISPAAGGFKSPNMGTGATYTFTFTKAGTFAYVCSIHPFMHGTVVVTG